MRRFLMKKAGDLNVGETFGFLVIYMALYLGFVWIVLEFETITSKIKSAWRRVRDFLKKLKRKIIG